MSPASKGVGGRESSQVSGLLRRFPKRMKGRSWRFVDETSWDCLIVNTACFAASLGRQLGRVCFITEVGRKSELDSG